MINVKKMLPIIIIAILLAIIFAGCEYTPTPAEGNTIHQIGQKQTEDIVKDLIENDSLPRPKNALDRENLKRRIEFMDQKDRIGYLYLLTDNGQLIKEVQVLGKVTGLNTYLTPMEKIEWFEDVDLGEYHGDVYVVTEAPDLDGTYGENINGIFWFTPDGVYQEYYDTKALYSSERLTFTSPPLLIEVRDQE